MITLRIATPLALAVLMGGCRAPRPKPLWYGARYTDLDRDLAVERGLQFIYRVASQPQYFADYGGDLLWCFYSISDTSQNPRLREIARTMGRERARQWRRAHFEPPANDVDNLSAFLFGTDAADRLGVRDDAVKDRIRRAAEKYSAVDFLSFDPSREPPPADLPRSCPKCDYHNPRGATTCKKCNTALKFQSPYDIWLDALITTYTGEIYGVKLGASYADVLKWISVMRPYRPQAPASETDFDSVTYAVTHVIYTLNDYGRYRLSPAWLPQEFDYLRANLSTAEHFQDVETVGEFLDTLRAFGLSEADAVIREGVDYALAHQNADGSWGVTDENDIYSRYHSTWTVVDGLRQYAFRGERLRSPELMTLISARK